MGAYKQSRLGKSAPGNGQKSTGGSGGGYTSTIEWVRYTFSPDEKRTIKETPLDIERCMDTLASLVEKGHKLTFSPANGNGFCGASLFGWADDCPNKGFGVSGEGGSFEAALKSLYWKLELLQHDLRVSTISGDDDFR